MKFQPGDVVVFEHPEYETETIVLIDFDPHFAGGCWTAEDTEYFYQEQYLRKLTKLEKALS